MLEQTTADDRHAQLLRRVAAGEVQAMSDLYDEISTPLFSVAFRILGDAAEAEEVIQDAFVQVWEKASSFDPVLGSAFHWALSIARHRAIDRLRSRQRRARLVEQVEAASAALPPSVSAPDAGLVVSEDAVAVRSVLATLPKDQRQAIELAFFSGLSHPEIVETLHEPLGTVKARIRRGLLKLRDGLQNYPS